jgi:hypothetical protein
VLRVSLRLGALSFSALHKTSKAKRARSHTFHYEPLTMETMIATQTAYLWAFGLGLASWGVSCSPWRSLLLFFLVAVALLAASRGCRSLLHPPHKDAHQPFRTRTRHPERKHLSRRSATTSQRARTLRSTPEYLLRLALRLLFARRRRCLLFFLRLFISILL